MATPAEAPPELLLQRRLRAYELALDSARRDAVHAAQTLSRLTARIAELELELSLAREAPARLEARLAEQQRARRGAEQRAYAERAYREELQQELAALERGRERAEEAQAALSAAAQRRRELEEEIERLRRRGDEAEHLAAVSASARERSERRQAELTAALARSQAQPPGPPARHPERLGIELALARRACRRAVQRPRALLPVRLPGSSLALERELLRQRPAVRGVTRTVPPASSPHAALLAELRAELARLARLVDRERAARRAAEARADALASRVREGLAGATAATEALRRLSPPASRAHPPGGGDPVEPERLAAALARLRESAEPAEPAEPGASSAAVAPWLRAAFARVAREDPAAAGELALALLPAQGLAHPEPVAYDLVLDGRGCLQVTAAAGETDVLAADAPRPSDAVSFTLTGEPGGVGRLLAAGRLRRRFGRRLARVAGDRSALAALDALLDLRVSVADLLSAGFVPEAEPALRLAAAMIAPPWTAGSAFRLAHRAPGDEAAPGPALVVDDGRRVRVTLNDEPATTTIVCRPERLLAVLDGAETADVTLEGPREPLARVQRWVNRAQSG